MRVGVIFTQVPWKPSPDNICCRSITLLQQTYMIRFHTILLSAVNNHEHSRPGKGLPWNGISTRVPLCARFWFMKLTCACRFERVNWLPRTLSMLWKNILHPAASWWGKNKYRHIFRHLSNKVWEGHSKKVLNQRLQRRFHGSLLLTFNSCSNTMRIHLTHFLTMSIGHG